MDAIAQRPEADPASGKYDIAVANLQAAVGLPGTEDLDIPRCLNWLDEVANRIRIETLRCSYLFRDRPEEFQNSPAYFSMAVLTTVLGRDLGIRYDPECIRRIRGRDPNRPKPVKPEMIDSRGLFIHGLIDGPGGTCASMPVLYVALGRRLGYPLKLVLAKVHSFVRWDDPDGKSWSPGDRFNVEATCVGLRTYPDDHYRKWPNPIEQWEVDSGVFLRSLTPKEEVASFRGDRGLCLWGNDRLTEGYREFRLAFELAEQSRPYFWLAKEVYRQYRLAYANKSRAELLATGLSRAEECWIQDLIVWVHKMRERDGIPGFNWAEYGIYPKRLPPPRSRPVSNAPHLPALGASAPPVSTPMTAGKARQQAERLHEYNRQNQERVRQGLGGLNPKDFGL